MPTKSHKVQKYKLVPSELVAGLGSHQLVLRVVKSVEGQMLHLHSSQQASSRLLHKKTPGYEISITTIRSF
jgi:hypothetical protein